MRIDCLCEERAVIPKKWSHTLALVSWLFALGDAQAQQLSSTPVAEMEQPTGKHGTSPSRPDVFLETGLGIGRMSYYQTARENGYNFDDGYQARWSGTVLAVNLAGGYYFHPQWAVGFAATFLDTFSSSGAAKAADGFGPTRHFTVAHRALGGVAAALLAYRPAERVRLEGTLGFAETGMHGELSWGGYGPSLTLGGKYIVPLEHLYLGFGAHGQAMALRYGSLGSPSVEHGPLVAGFLDASFGWNLR